jgi:hypothetical protein
MEILFFLAYFSVSKEVVYTGVLRVFTKDFTKASSSSLSCPRKLKLQWHKEKLRFN